MTGAASEGRRNARRKDRADTLSVGVVGLGQIGGSILRCLHRQRPHVNVTAYDRRPALSTPTRPFAAWAPTLADLVVGSDLVILAVPVPGILALLPRIGRLARRRTSPKRLVVCDVGSVKAPVRDAATRWAGAYDYVGLHPLAGGERSGWEASDANLFRGRTVCYCAEPARGERLARRLISLLGGRAYRVDPQVHDTLVAQTIGLPHLLAFAAAGLSNRRDPAAARLQGGSWQSLTRVVRSDPAMVAGFLHANAADQRRILRPFLVELNRLDRLLGRATAGPLERALRHASGVLSGPLRRRV